jgi:hypothetical protein
MSDTPETNAAEERCIKTGFKTGYVDVEFACKLERERDRAKSSLSICDGVRELTTELCVIGDELNTKLSKERNEALAQMCQAVGYLSTIAGDCDAWLNNQCDETACEFIKAVRDYAKKGINA